MFKKLFLVAALALSLSADDLNLEDKENDIRQWNHDISLVKYENNGEINYYVSWSTSKGGDTHKGEWTNDLYYTNAYFSNGYYGDDNDNEALVINDDKLNKSAQGTVTTTSINKNSNNMLSVWEDGRANIPSDNRAQVRGQLFSIGLDGAIAINKSDFIIDEAIENNFTIEKYEAHSPTATHVKVTDSDEDLYVVVYAEDGHQGGARIKVRLLDEDGNIIAEKYLSSEDDDSAWPISTTDDKNHAFIAWTSDNSHNMKGCVVSVDMNYSITCKERTYFTKKNKNKTVIDVKKVKKYNYQVAYLPMIKKFFLIAKKLNKNTSMAVVLKKNGTVDASNKNIKGYPIVRQAQVAVTCGTKDTCKVVYPSGNKKLGILKVTSYSIDAANSNWHQDLRDVDVANDFTVYKVNDFANGKVKVQGYWPTTGIAVTYAQDWGSSNIWESGSQNGNENKLQFLFNDVDGNLVNVPLKIDVGF